MQITSLPYTRAGYIAGAYGGIVCGVLVLIRGDHRRAGEVGHALCSAHLSITL